MVYALYKHRFWEADFEQKALAEEGEQTKNG
jgi:hypothetical protein